MLEISRVKFIMVRIFRNLQYTVNNFFFQNYWLNNNFNTTKTMRFNVLYMTVFFIPWLNEKKFSTLLRPFGQYLYGFRALDRLFDLALQFSKKVLPSLAIIRVTIFLVVSPLALTDPSLRVLGGLPGTVFWLSTFDF